MRQAGAIELAAELLGLQIVRRFDGSPFGAALVGDREGRALGLRASTDLQLAPEWATGAAMATRLPPRRGLGNVANMGCGGT